MGRTGIIVTGLIGIALVVGAVIVIGGGNNKKTDTTSSQSTTSQPAASQPSSSNQSNSQPTESSNVISYSDSGFSPGSLTVKSGDSVTIKNNTSQTLQVQSNPHPIHTDDPELNIGTIEPGQSKTFTLTTKGTFGYHNHLDPSQTGILIVQ